MRPCHDIGAHEISLYKGLHDKYPFLKWNGDFGSTSIPQSLMPWTVASTGRDQADERLEARDLYVVMECHSMVLDDPLANIKKQKAKNMECSGGVTENNEQVALAPAYADMMPVAMAAAGATQEEKLTIPPGAHGAEKVSSAPASEDVPVKHRLAAKMLSIFQQMMIETDQALEKAMQDEKYDLCEDISKAQTKLQQLFTVCLSPDSLTPEVLKSLLDDQDTHAPMVHVDNCLADDMKYLRRIT